MARYRIVIKASASKELEGISGKKIRQRLVRAITQLSDDPRPHSSVKMSGYDRYRLRCGPWRIVYAVHDEEGLVRVVKVAHRKEVYRGPFD